MTALHRVGGQGNAHPDHINFPVRDKEGRGREGRKRKRETERQREREQE